MKSKLIIALASLGLFTLSVGAEEMVVLKTSVPKPLFIGTKVPIKIKNLDKPLSKFPSDYKVPKGTTNVALNKSISGSDEEPIIGDLELLTDGDKDGSDGYYVELGPGLQHVQIDLEKAHDIYGVVMWHFSKNARVYHDVVVQVSDDAKFVKGVTTVYNSDDDNSAGLGVGKDKPYIETNLGRLVRIPKGAKGRYVRLYTNGNTANEMNHYIEVEVHGKPAS